ncbi:MAG: aminodeoxychorismate/anthranilate synthase component II [Ponticaulis sp.]|nr:aminodeoxychorismate/anthranilate synthase component II [Ponticaulis sp.]|tara:strand:+ start:36043 stop:36615 length:573 start_codon:yes stop_codon:yes gene_type:complete
MILLVDNYDSFTYNLAHYLADSGGEPHVIRNDQMTAQDALALKPRAIVMSPGPCTPNEAGICMDLVKQAPDDLAMLGVCLGHQSIGQALGGDIVTAREIRHGKISTIHHTGGTLFKDIPNDFQVVRYHSLAIDPPKIPSCLIVDATTEDGEIMAIHHESRPLFGVQFHPESIRTEYGHQLLRNFLNHCTS